jgi:hypothetical protein
VLSEDLIDRLSPIKFKASSLFEKATEKASSFDDYLLNNISNSISSNLNAWLSAHPIVLWLVSHPIISSISGLIAVILIIRLLATVYRAIANLIDRMWLWILRSPLFLLGFVFGWKPKPKNSSNLTVTNYEVTNNSEQLQQIMLRLDKIQQQQEQIMHDLTRLKQQPSIIDNIEPQQLRGIEEKIIKNK